jgi:hypothetical protein
MAHKHRGSRWTVRVAGKIDAEVFDWLCDNWGEEDFENGPWARLYSSWGGQNHATYDVTDRRIIVMLSLRFE